MNMRRALLLGSALLFPASLGGCVAAVAAIPVLAGGAVAATGGDGIDETGSGMPDNDGADLPPPPFERQRPSPEVAPPAEARPATVAATPAAAPPPGLQVALPTERLAIPEEPVAPTTPAPVSVPAPAQAAASVPQLPMAVASSARQLVIDPADTDYGSFFDGAMAQAAVNPLSEKRTSAILRTSLSAQPELTDCGMLQPVVLIDLDPAGGILSPDLAVAANPDLATALELLRKRDVGIFWISDAPITAANPVRARLVASGLDPAAGDSLLLSYGKEDRKQLRREGLAKSHCVIAIAGDTKSDFDELYDYLKVPEAGVPFDALIGKSWFLTPLPLKGQ